MKKFLVGLSLIMVLLAAAACSSSITPMTVKDSSQGLGTVSANRPAPTTYAYTASSPMASGERGKVQYSGDHSGVTYSSITNESANTMERMVVRTGGMEMVVQDITSAIDEISRIAGDSGGYVVDSQKWKEGERIFGSISIRVPAGRYNGTILALRALAMEIINESTSSQDVTEEYTDLNSKVKNLEATEAQLLKIMEKAEKTEDILSIQRELTTVRGDIEQVKGRMQYLERTAAMSLINIKLSGAMINLKFSANKVLVNTGDDIFFTPEVTGGFAPYNYHWDFGDGNNSIEKNPRYSYQTPGVYRVTFKVTDDKGYTNEVTRDGYIKVEGSWSPGSVARSAWNGLTIFGRALVNILIWLGIFSPLWIIIGGIIFWIMYRKRKKK